MKKAFTILALTGLTLVSCTKDYSCSCEEKEVIGTDVEFSEYKFTVEGATKVQAQAACNEATLKVEESGYSYEQTCTLTKK